MSKAEPLQLKNVLCIRADNMGDLLMTTPALRALKETYHCRITVLTSAMGSLITPFIQEIDETIIADLPWIKTEKAADDTAITNLIQSLTSFAFDAAIIFTVYSQNSLPAAMLSLLARIPVRVAYCRENPYTLLTHWIPDEEPYRFIQHQVERDLKLASSINAFSASKQLSIHYSEEAKQTALEKLRNIGVDTLSPFIIFHPGVSEDKRKYPTSLWIEVGRKFLQNHSQQIVITGSQSEILLVNKIQSCIGFHCFSAAGLFTIEELIAAVDLSILLVSVNTGTVHIAAALQKPVVVLYALTNPQHTPWQTSSKVLFFSVEEKLKSRNQVVNYVSETIMDKTMPYPTASEVIEAIGSLLPN